MSSFRLHLLPFSLLSVLQVAAAPQASGIFLNSSSIAAFSHTPSGCDQCTVTALEQFLSYPHSLEIQSITATNVVVPMVTVHPDGRRETNLVTETPAQTGAFTSAPPEPTDPYASLTWEPYANVTLTYPTTYVQFYGLRGGTFYPVSPESEPTATCTYDDQELQLPTNSITGLVVPLPAGVTVDSKSPTAISAPHAIHDYLNGIPAVASQFAGTDVASCAWTKIVAATPPAEFSTPTLTATTQATVNKVSVSVLTEVTARQVVITAPGNNRATETQAIVHTESTDEALVQPAGSTPVPNNIVPLPQNQQQSTQTGPGIAAIIGAVLNPTTGSVATAGAQGGSGSAGVNVQAVSPAVGATGSNGQNTPAVQANGGTVQAGTATGGNAQATGTSGSVVQSGGQGGQANGALPAPLVIDIGGTPTTIAPTVIRNPDSTGSVTAFVLGPGSTLILGGAPITVSGTAIRASGTTTTGGVGGAIASGLGYTGPLANDSLASSIRGPDLPLWVLAVVAGVLGTFAIAL